MNSNEKYFVSLISSHLNKVPPALPEGINWEEIYRLAEIHNICAIVTDQILKLPKDSQPDMQIMSKFRQQLGYTLIDCEEKEKAIDFLKSLFEKNEIEFLFVKGAMLREYYPVKEFRTSGDIDVVIKAQSIKRLISLLSGFQGVKKKKKKKDLIVCQCFEQEIEIHSNFDCDNPYFESIFDASEKCSYEYKISDEEHLLYVLCHIIKHFNSFGAGIKMFADIDVLIRHIGDFDYDSFMDKCRSLNIEAFAKSSLSLCNYWFGTPVKAEISFEANSKFRELFENEIINSGAFGFNKRDLGDYYVNKGIGKDGKNNLSAKVRAFFKLLFPSKNYLKRSYTYCDRHPILLPLAWLNRLYDGIFKRGRQSRSTVNSIFNSGDETAQYKKLLDELEI